MKRMFAMVSMFLCFGTNLLAVSVGDTIKYQINSSLGRTSVVIKGASATLTVKERVTNGACGDGYIVNLDYKLDVVFRGEQTGNMDLFVPDSMFASNLYDELKNNTMNLGVVTLSYKGQETARDSSGNEYLCNAIQGSNIDHNFGGAPNKSKVMKFGHAGKIAYITNMEIKFRVNPAVPVIGAVEIDISGKSNFGIPFTAGMDVLMTH